jgi:hypothetical protein
VGTNADGRLEVFYTDDTGTVHHKWQQSPNGSWSGWESLGSFARTGANYANARIVVGRNLDGRLELFLADGIDVFHKWQASAGGGWASGWHILGQGGRLFWSVGGAQRNTNGRLEVFAASSQLGPHTIRQTTPNAGWGQWQGVGSLSTGTPIVRATAMAVNSDGRLEIFGVDDRAARFNVPVGNLHHAWQTSPSGSWSGWEKLNGGTVPTILTITGVAAIRDSSNRLHVFALDVLSTSGNQVRHWAQGSSGWSELARIGSSDVSSHISVGMNANGILELFAFKSDGKIYRARQSCVGCTGWTSYSAL